MTPVERLRYSLYLSAAGGGILILALSVASADAVGLISPSVVDRSVFNPLFLLGLYVVAYLIAPLVSRRLPILRKRS